MVHFHFIRKQLKVFFSLALVIYVLSVARRQYVEELKGTSQYRRRNRTDADEGQVTRHEVLWGTLNVHRWNSLCGYTVDNLRDCQSFPKVPNFRSSVNILEFFSSSTNFGQRIFGYIHPPKSGLYQFSISSDDFSELWLSSDENPNNASLVSYIGGPDKQKGTFEFGWTRRTEFNKYESQTSRDIELCEGKKYFIEVLHKQNGGLAHVHVIWKLPGTEYFRSITHEFISSYMEKHASLPNDIGVLKQHKTSSIKYTFEHYRKLSPSLAESKTRYIREHHHFLSKCNRSALNRNPKRYEGIGFVNTASVYPSDGSSELMLICREPLTTMDCLGTPLLSKERASEIVEKYLKYALPKKYALRSVLKVEEFKTKTSPTLQYFVDIEVFDKSNGEVARIAEPVWENSIDKNLCYPAETSWNPDVMIYVIVTVKNQGIWLRHFIDTMVYLQEQTNDSNIHPVIVDFGSKDVGFNDTEIYLERSPLKQYTVIHKTGDFHKTAAINEAAASVKDNNSIVFQLDLHLDLPLNLMETVRKHTIQGKLAFVPILMRLSCGSTPTVPFGHWEELGYGLFSVYKSDWIRFGGMNEKEFTDRWGGEDWEMIDRVIMHNIEVQRLRIPGLFHHYHTKDKLWQNTV